MDVAKPRASFPLSRFWSALNHDFCPQQNQWAYKLKHPICVLGISAVLALFCGYVINPLSYVLAATLIGVLVIGLAWPAIAIRGVAVTVDWGRTRIHEGDSVLVRVHFRNRLPIPLVGLRVTSFGGVGDALLPKLSAVGNKTVEWRTSATRRGVFPCDHTGHPVVETSMPFGVWTATKPIEVVGRLTVWPAKVELAGRIDVATPRSGEDRMTDRRAGNAGDMLGVRRFRMGDSLRRVHWAQTARQRELIVCERQASTSAVVRVGVVLSTDGASFENTLRAAASVITAVCRTNASVELFVAGQQFGPTEDERVLLDHLAACTQANNSSPGSDAVDLLVCADGEVRSAAHVVSVGSTDHDWQTATANCWGRICHVA